ncbi:hypothetical protein SAMN05421504_104515 [Amycolatopsis xylanica]|uniref:Uncharacterized protein n=1 Tax=Amycolatopsis xylanica TaxID=589385 RepID=A0A1H3H4X0_9PSEU|nr:hypothetical protein [Amycolatopsis xylanica]SDY10370.1 hypothetical protein SAMN05421504_104515 [Amycolatopsis xylanica]
MHTPSARSVPESLDPGNPVREAVLQAAVARLDEYFGDRVQVAVEQLNRVGDWVFLHGRMHGAEGGRPYYAGTIYETRRHDGVMSDVYAVLLKKSEAGRPDDARSWRLSDYAIGPTDVTWLEWPDRHQAPPAVFGF